MQFGWIRLRLCCEAKLMKNGHKHRNAMRKLVVEGGWVQKNCTISVGQTKRRVKDAAKKKARRSTNCTTARAGKKSEARSQRDYGNGNKEQEHQRKIGSVKEESRRIL